VEDRQQGLKEVVHAVRLPSSGEAWNGERASLSRMGMMPQSTIVIRVRALVGKFA
jgi:hypothetical protein